MRRKRNVHDKESVSPCSLLRAVLAPACQRLWRVGYNDACGNSRVFALLPTLAPDRLDVSSRTLSSRFAYPPCGGGYIVRVLSTVRYLAALTRRVRLMEQPVTSVRMGTA